MITDINYLPFSTYIFYPFSTFIDALVFAKIEEKLYIIPSFHNRRAKSNNNPTTQLISRVALF